MSIYQIVYCSKNCMDGPVSEIDAGIRSILAMARAKNKEAGVSGALLFNGQAFAQVLEGALPAVEEIFEKIQCDDRHSSIVILRNAEAPSRAFSDWSMAYADPATVERICHAKMDLDEAFSHPEAGAPRIISLLHQLVATEFV